MRKRRSLGDEDETILAKAATSDPDAKPHETANALEVDSPFDCGPPTNRGWARRARAEVTEETQIAVGDQVRVDANSNDSSYEIGHVYIVTSVDRSDGTAKARDPRTGLEGNWLRLSEVSRLNGLGWAWLKSVLDPTDVALLSHFDGLSALGLRRDLQSSIVATLPGLREAILALDPKPGVGERNQRSGRARR
jgi:hypothetical protein